LRLIKECAKTDNQKRKNPPTLSSFHGQSGRRANQKPIARFLFSKNHYSAMQCACQNYCKLIKQVFTIVFNGLEFNSGQSAILAGCPFSFL
jgi:hypothetical protein